MGCGRVFERFHLPAIARVPEVSLVAACDTNRIRLNWGEHPFAPSILSDTPAVLLRCPGLEAVLVLTPPPSHAANVVQALHAGLHVLVEKPMALSAAEARQMADAARLSRRHLQVGFTRRFRRPYRQLRDALLQNPGGCRKMYFELAFPAGSWNAETGFLGDDSRGGGVLDDVLSHQVDLVCWLIGARPDRVRCKATSSGGVSAELEIGGVSVHCDSAHGRYAERLEVELAGGRVLQASGSHFGAARLRSERWRRSRALVLDRLSLLGDRLLHRANVTLGSFENQLRDFVSATRGGSSEGATAEDGLKAVEIVQACRTSALGEGEWQPVDTTARPAE